LLTRSIDLIDPFELTIEEKIYRAAKHICTVFAIAALMLTAIDLADIRSVDNAADMIHNNRQRFADLPNLIRNGIQSIAIAAPSPYVTAMIPRGEISVTPRARAARRSSRASSVLPRRSPSLPPRAISMQSRSRWNHRPH